MNPFSQNESLSSRFGRFFSNLFQNRSGQRSENQQSRQSSSEYGVSETPRSNATHTSSPSDSSFASERPQCLPTLLQSRRSSSARRFSTASGQLHHNSGSHSQFVPQATLNETTPLQNTLGTINREIGNSEEVSSNISEAVVQTAAPQNSTEAEIDSLSNIMPESTSSVTPQVIDNANPISTQPTPQMISAMVEAFFNLEVRSQSRNGDRSNSRISRSDTPLPDLDITGPPSRNVSLRVRIPPNSFENVVGAVSQATGEATATRSASPTFPTLQSEILRELRRQSSTVSETRSNHILTEGRSNSRAAAGESSLEIDDGILNTESSPSELNNSSGVETNERPNEAESLSLSEDGINRQGESDRLHSDTLDAFASFLALMIGDSLRRRVQEISTETDPTTEAVSSVEEANENPSDQGESERAENNESTYSNETNRSDMPQATAATESRNNVPRMRVFPSGSGPENPFFFVVYIPPNTMVLMTMRGGLPSQSLQGQPPASAKAVSELMEVDPLLCLDEKCLICQEEFTMDDLESEASEPQVETNATEVPSSEIDLMALFNYNLQADHSHEPNNSHRDITLPDEPVESLQQVQPPLTFESSEISDEDRGDWIQEELVHPNVLETARESNPNESDDLTITSELTSKGKEAEPVLRRRKILSMPCKHFFHADELIEWLKFSNTCPVCRYELLTENEDYNKLVVERMSARDKEKLTRTSMHSETHSENV